MSEDGDENRTSAPVAGPSMPSHLLQRSAAVSMGPIKPPHLLANATRGGTADYHAASPPKRVLGPTMPPRADEQDAKLSSGAQAFLDREKRMEEAAEREAAGLAPNTEEASRPDWMMAPPTAQSFSETLQKDQSAALKNRGFSQVGNARVQRGKGGAGLGGIDEEDSSLWTETPQEREQRLKEEELGIRSKASNGRNAETKEEREKRAADRDREEKLQQAIREHEAQRGPSLLEQHQSRRREELKAKKDDKDDSSNRHRKSRKRQSDSESEDSRDDHRSDSRRDRKDKDIHRSRRHRRDEATESDSYSDSDTKRRQDNTDKSRIHHRDRTRGDGHRRSDSHRSHRDRSKDRDREERRKNKEKERERKQKRREREREEKEEKRRASTMIWDREAAMSVGGKLLDNQKRMETIRSAAGLGNRFGSGTARYL